MCKSKSGAELNKEFIEKTKRVIGFFNKFNSEFNGIDKIFDDIDGVGGVDDEKLEELLSELNKYHENIYKECDDYINVDNERENEDFKNINIDSFGSAQIIKDSLKGMQSNLQNYFSCDETWSGQKQCLDIISAALTATQQLLKDHKDNDLLYGIAHIICELIADCSISICGIIPLKDWNFGTDGYACLSAENQLIALLNKAILVDRMYICVYTLKDVVYHLNRVANGFSILNWCLYYNIGFLNYKIHSYSDAIGFFDRIVSENQSNIRFNKKLFHSNLLLAYCYEYQTKYAEAIKILACSVKQMTEFFDNIPYSDIQSNNIHVIKSFIQDVIKKSAESKDSYDSLLCVYFKNVDISKMGLSEEQKEIFHALAHCINEYAIEKRNSEDTEKTDDTALHQSEQICFGKLVFFARSLMRFIATKDPEYWTCYATIHGECSDYYKAIEELKTAQKKLEEQGRAKETLLAEINFFDYYFHQMIGEDLKETRQSFEQYCHKYSDNDAECHIKIFEFKNELKKYFSLLSSALLGIDNLSSVTKDKIPAMSQELEDFYNEMCMQHPSLYMNANIRIELRKMQRAFVCLKRYRDYLEKQNSENYAKLINAFKRYFTARNDYDITENKLLNVDNLDLNINQAMYKGYKDQKSVVYCLHNSDSIFLLAPISGVVVFEYQTGKLDQLFEQNVFDYTSCKLGSMNIEDLRRYNIKNITYRNNPKIKGIKWNDNVLPDNIHVYCWKQSDPNRIIIVNKDTSKNRQIVDAKHFSQTIHNIIDKANAQCKQQKFDNFGQKCKGVKVKIDWTEIINETETAIEIFLFWKSETDDCRCVLLKATDLNGISPDKCKLHSILNGVQWDYSNNLKSDDSVIPSSEPISEEKSYNLLNHLKEKVREISNKMDGNNSTQDQFRNRKIEMLNSIIFNLRHGVNLTEEMHNYIQGFLQGIDKEPLSDLEALFSKIKGLISV